MRIENRDVYSASEKVLLSMLGITFLVTWIQTLGSESKPKMALKRRAKKGSMTTVHTARIKIF